MKFLIADTFTRSLGKLDGQSQALVKQAAFDFQVNPANPGFQFHKLDRAKDRNFWSFRVNQDLRIIVHRTSDTLALCYADHHDAAYDWAEVRKLETHPETGAAQIVEVVERVEEVVRHVVRDVEQEAPLFAKYERDYLMALGVPGDWVDAVRTIGESGFDKVVSHLPAEAAERLLQLACGEPVPRPSTTAAPSPFEHPDAQRRFRIVDDHDELRRALDAPWEQWVVFLHPAQRAVVQKHFSGPARVTGSAGTGKSVVAMHRASALLQRDSGSEARVLLTTFSKTLAARLSQSVDRLLAPQSAARQRLVIDHLHRVARDLWVERSGASFAALDHRKLTGLLESSKNRVAPASDISIAFLRAEWDAIVDPWGVGTWDVYRNISRAGRATPLGAKQRLVLWRVFEDLHSTLAERGWMTWNGLCHAVARLLESRGEHPFAHVVADEAQDFGPAELTLLRALVPDGADDLFLCGDAGQRIYKLPYSWLAAGVDIRGRSTRLQVNYRTTEQIRRFADSLLPDSLDEGAGDKEKRATVSILSGPQPEVKRFASVATEIAGVADWIGAVLADGYQPRDIALFARTEAILRDRAEPALLRAGLTGHHLSDEHPPSSTDASLGTMHRAKGLEFKAVAVVGCDADALPFSYAATDLVDEADRDALLDQERQLLYVATTRARERLLVTYAGRPSRFLPPAR